ncbi:hypothetical protein LSAT2_027095 [Lamellibrachia satsuma]|nr:hypothetical protein LSAT2_027095 [Lamellibrachia satsuma]
MTGRVLFLPYRHLVKKRDTAKSAGDAVSGHVYVDTSCGQDVIFRFGHLDMTQTYNVTVRSPRGLNYTNSKVDKDSGTITVEVNETEVGKWHYTVKSGDTDSLLTVQTSLKCAPSPDAVDIQVTPQMNINRVNFADAGTEYLILAAQVTADELPVDNATVVASVTLGNGTVVDVRLWDNGAGG